MIQILRVYTNRQGNRWARDLQRVAFAMNNAVRLTSQTSAAQLVYGKRLSLLPPIQTAEEEEMWREFGLVQPSQEEWQLAAQRMELEEKMARDALLMAKNSQAIQANRHRRPEVVYKVGDLVYLNTKDFRHEYKTSSTRNSAKLIPRWEGPYIVTEAFPKQSLYDLNLVLSKSTSTTRRHASLLKPFRTSTKYHGDVSPTLLSSDQPPPPRVLQVIEERVLKPNQRHPGVPQVRVRVDGERVSGRWMSRDEAEKYEGWSAAWEEYLGDDELYLDMIPLDHNAVKRGEQEIYLYTDASNTGIGAWLGAGKLPNAVAPVAYFSRSLNDAERNYPVHNKEMLAIIEALEEWRPLLLGVPVHVMTDHATLRHVFTQPKLSEQQKRWLLVLPTSTSKSSTSLVLQMTSPTPSPAYPTPNS
ncbi:hypothetical protein B9479_008297, partial [Cryptococcus floricola]